MVGGDRLRLLDFVLFKITLYFDEQLLLVREVRLELLCFAMFRLDSEVLFLNLFFEAVLVVFKGRLVILRTDNCDFLFEVLHHLK